MKVSASQATDAEIPKPTSKGKVVKNLIRFRNEQNLTEVDDKPDKPNADKMGTAPNEELCLRWNDFESILSRSFAEMRDDREFFDVKVACFDDDSKMKTIPAHKVVLSACSPVFKELLRQLDPVGGGKAPLIFLRGITFKDVEAVLDFMYNGQTKVQHDELDSFLAAAEDLKIKGLTTNSAGGSGGANNSDTPSRKRPSPAEGSNMAAARKPGPSSAVKKQKVATPAKVDPEMSSETMVKSERILEGDDSAMLEGDDGSYPGYEDDPAIYDDNYDDNDASNIPSDSKGNPPFSYLS